MELWQIPASGINPNFAEAAERGQAAALNARDLMAQTQVRSGQAQQIALQNQEMLRYQEDQQKFADAYRATNGDISKIGGDFIQRGGRPGYLGEWQKQQAGIVHSIAQGKLSDIEATQKRYDTIGGRLSAFNDEQDDQKKAANWKPTLMGLRNEGLLTDQELAGYPAEFPGSDAVKSRIMGFNTESQLHKQAADKQRADAAKQRGDAAQLQADLKKQELEARLPEVQAKSEQAVRANRSARLELAAHRGDDSYAEAYHAEEGWKFPDIPTPQEYDKEKTPDILRTWGLTPEQRTKANTAQQRVDQAASLNEARERNWNALRSEAARRNDILASRTGQPTPGQQGVQDRFDQRRADTLDKQAQARADALDKEEQFLHKQRLEIGSTLQNGTFTDTKGQTQALTGGTDGNDPKAPYRARLDAYTKQLQGVQFKKAKLYGFAAPDLKAAEATADGQTATAPDGSTWKKQDGVMYFESAGAPAAATAPKPAATPAAQPAAAPPTAAPIKTPAAAPQLQNLQTNKAGHVIGWNGKNWVDAKNPRIIIK